MRIFYVLLSILVSFILINNKVLSEQKILPNQQKEVATLNSDCMTFEFGTTPDKESITIYILPSCLHCAEFIDTNYSFLEKYSQLHGVTIKYILDSTTDIFILKLFRAKFPQNKIEMFWKIIEYMKRVTATIYKIKTVENEFEKYKTIAKEFGFTEEEINRAKPNPDESFELEIMARYHDHANEVSEINGKNNTVELPLLVKEGISLSSLPNTY